MSTSPAYKASGIINLKLAAATGPFIRVTINSSGEAAIASGSVKGIGTTMSGGATGDRVPVRLYADPGTHVGKATGAMATIGSTVYATANGEVDDAGTVILGMQLTAAAAAGDLVEYFPTSANGVT
jgi:hypothetical protein